ncbi:MAG: sigma-70 family RNA polymerase sigma factor [Anaerolineae bacterium]
MKHSNNDINWEAVYHDQLPRIYNFFRYRVGDDLLAEDLTALTFEKAWKSRDQYRSDLSAFSTWLLSIARNAAADHFRRARPEVALYDTPDSPEARPVEASLLHEDEMERLSTLLHHLDARERELIALKYGAELTNRAIGQMLGLSESNVGTILYRVVARLRSEWEVKIK